MPDAPTWFGGLRVRIEHAAPPIGTVNCRYATEYPRTVLWAQALHRAFADIDGLLWMSRQFNAARALVLFGDRVRQAELVAAKPALPLRAGPGRKLVDEAANRAGIVIVS